MRYNQGRGYYFAFNRDNNVTIMHPIDKFFHKNMSNFRDKNGMCVTKKILEVIENNGSGYAKFFFAKPDKPDAEYEKLVYVRYFPKLNWVIGTGEYIKDAVKELQRDIIDRVSNKNFENGGYFWVADNVV